MNKSTRVILTRHLPGADRPETVSTMLAGSDIADQHFLEVVGVLPHCTKIWPRTKADAAALRDWLERHYEI